jgi:two-component system, NtrC family, sensor kinase
VFLLGASVSLVFGISGWVALDLHRRDMVSTLENRASDVAETLLAATWSAMLENDERQLHQITENATRDERVLVLRVISAGGEIRHSSTAHEVGSTADLSQPTCQHCHAAGPGVIPEPVQDGFRAYDRSSEDHIIGVVIPVLNSVECWSAGCHVHDKNQSVLGMLEVEFSTREMEVALASERSGYLTLGLITFCILTTIPGVLAWRLVHRPFHRLLEATEKIGRGDLHTRLDAHFSGELEDLAWSINEMASRLQRAQAELKDWGNQLEERVADKSRELERAQEHLVFSEKMVSLGKLAAIVAHEINNPLGGILVSVKLLRRRLPKMIPAREDRETVDATLAMIEQETARSGDVVRNLLLFSREGDVTAAETSLEDVVARTLSLIAHKAQLQGVQIEFSPQAGLPLVECDANQIEQALLALVLNAIDAMPEGGQLRIKLDRSSLGVRVAVRDNGNGIPEEIRPRLFEPFFTTKDEGQGTGLGLSVMYGIVRSHGGTVEFESEPGKGTCFLIDLPLLLSHGADASRQVVSKGVLHHE